MNEQILTEAEVELKVLQAFAAVGAQWAIEELQRRQGQSGQQGSGERSGDRSRR